MRIGFVGLGKLGLPCAVAAALKGHDVMGFDIDPAAMTTSPRPYRETGPDGISPFDPVLAGSSIRFGTLAEVLDHAEIVFLAVQTPHDRQFEGITRLTGERRDFDYSHLIAAVRAVSALVTRPTVVAVVSTVLPGTLRRDLLSEASTFVRLCYTPSFIAMGTTMRDYLDPEFVVLGASDESAAAAVEAYFKTIVRAPILRMTVENAELVKVTYNTFIGLKIAFANTVMEICHQSPGTDVDVVMNALKQAHRRLVGPSYMDGGMGDGGGCHPRDNIALSWLARELDLSYDMFEAVMTARERQTEWLADLMCASPLPKAIVGYSFKAGTNITVGSPALLLKQILEERSHDVLMYDPHVEGVVRDLSRLPPHVFLIGARHPEFANLAWPAGSTVIDPWRMIAKPPAGVTVIPVGVGPVQQAADPIASELAPSAIGPWPHLRRGPS